MGDTDYFLHNPHVTDITITWEASSSSGSFTIPAGDTVSFRAAAGAVPVDSGLYLRGSDVFWGVGMGDSTGAAFEWGYSLLPSTFLYREHFLGWAPGSIAVDTTGNPGNQDNVGVFLSVAQDNTRVFVDFDADGTADLIDANLDGTAESPYLTLNRLETQFIYDSANAAGGGDLSRAHFWATGDFTMAYGENGDTATTSTPSLDLGYIAIPGTDFISLVLTVDKSASPQVVSTASGSQATFSLRARSHKYSVSSITVTDTLPPGWQYVAGSTTITLADQTLSAANPTITGAGTALSPYILDWSTGTLGAMAENQAITITFRAQTTMALAAGTLSQNRVRAVGTRTVGTPSSTQTFTATDFAFVTSGDLQITKASSVAASTPLYPRDRFTYTVTVSNPSATSPLTNVALYDALPAGVSVVPGTTSLSLSNVGDRFGAVAYGSNDGSRSWTGNWAETSDDATAAAGVVRITGGELRLGSYRSVADGFTPTAYTNNDGTTSWIAGWADSQGDGTGAGDIRVVNGELRAAGSTQTAYRQVNLSGATTAVLTFAYRTSGNVENGEYAYVEVASSPAGPWTAAISFQNDQNGTVTYTIPAGLRSATTAVRVRTTGYDGGESFFVDNVMIAFDGAAPAITRGVDLAGSGATWAALGFSYRTSGNLENSDDVTVQYRLGGAGAWTTLATYTDDVSGIAAFSIPLASPANLTEIRFAMPAASDYADDTEFFYVDEVFLTYNRPAATGGDAPDLFSGYALPATRSLTATFDVTVDDPLASGIESITNTASTTSAQMPIQLSASVTNIVVNPSVLSATVGDRVWLDADGDGVEDVGEPGIANVEVTLKDQWGTPVDVTVTDVNGRYLFAGVKAGPDYYVEVDPGTLPGGVSQSFPVAATNNRSATFTLTDGLNYTTADVGYGPTGGTATFGDLVWVDADNDGLRDPGEIGLGGISVELWADNGNGVVGTGDTLVGTKTTAPDGSYLFTGVTATLGTEDYIVNIPTQGSLTGYTATTSTFRGYPDVTGGNAYMDADFGFRGTGVTTYTIQDRVWLDADGGQDFDSGVETGIAGVTMELLNASLQVIGTTTTGSGGTFTFSGLTGGGADYTTRISDTAGVLLDYFGTTTYAQARQRAESNLAANLDRTAAPSYGFLASRSLGDTLYYDNNNNRTQDTGENGIAGVVITLYRDTGVIGRVDNDQNGTIDETAVGTVTTDASGHYLFSGLANGNYVVSVPTPAGYTYTSSGTAPDGDASTAGTQRPATMAGANNLTVDLGFLAANPRTVSGTLWNDVNSSGTIDGSELGIAGVTLDVLQGTTVVATVTTNASGFYSVAGLSDVTYTVRVTDTGSALTGYAPTYELTEVMTAPFNYQESVNLAPGNVANVNFGYAKPRPTYAAVAQLKAVPGRRIRHGRVAHLSRGGNGGIPRPAARPGDRAVRATHRAARAGPRRAPAGRRLPLPGHGGGDRGAAGLRPPGAGRARPLAPLRAVHRDGGRPRCVARPRCRGIRGAGAARVQSARDGPRSLAPDAPDGRQAREAAGLGPEAASAGPRVQGDDGGQRYPLPPRGRHRAVLRLRGGLYEPGARGSDQAQPPRERGALPAGRNRQRVLLLRRAGREPLHRRERLLGHGRAGADREPPARPTGGLLATSFTETRHQEIDQYPLLVNFSDPAADFWAWDYLYAGYAGEDARSFTIRADGVAGAGDASLTVHLVGGTDGVPGDDHHVQVLFNGVPVGEAQWDGLDPLDLGVAISPSSVLEGDNVVEVKAVLDSGIPESLFYVDSFDLVYERRYEAVADTLTFTAANGTDVAVGGFSQPEVLLFDVTMPSRPVLLTDTAVSMTGDGRYEVRFGAAGTADTLRFQALLPARPGSRRAWQAGRTPACAGSRTGRTTFSWPRNP